MHVVLEDELVSQLVALEVHKRSYKVEVFVFVLVKVAVVVGHVLAQADE